MRAIPRLFINRFFFFFFYVKTRTVIFIFYFNRRPFIDFFVVVFNQYITYPSCS